MRVVDASRSPLPPAPRRRSASIEDLRALPELAGNPLVPRVFAVVDTNGDGSLTLDEFVSAVGERLPAVAERHGTVLQQPASCLCPRAC